MGAWGTAIFSDDLACDIRAEWRRLIGDGLAPEAVTQQILSGYAEALNDPDESSVVWLALAVCQWKTGRVLEHVRDKAIDVIDTGTDLHRWETGRLRSARGKVLAQTRAQLVSPQPTPKRVGKRRRSETPFVPGDIVSYTYSAGDRFLFWVSRNHTDNGGHYNCVELLDFVGENPPTLGEIVRLPAMERRYEPLQDGSVPEPDRIGFVLIHASLLPKDRFAVLGNRPRPENRPHHDLLGVHVRYLDDWLRNFLPGGDHVLRGPRPG